MSFFSSKFLKSFEEGLLKTEPIFGQEDIWNRRSEATVCHHSARTTVQGKPRERKSRHSLPATD